MVNQFEIYWVSPDPTKGTKMKKTRPCVVVSPDEMNQSLRTVIIAPLTSSLRDFPTRVKVTVQNKEGQIALDQLRSLDRQRLGKKIGKLNAPKVQKVKAVLAEMFQ